VVAEDPARGGKRGAPFSHGPSMMRLAIALGVLILVTGCGLLPEVSHQPTIHNPFPQLTKVAVAPFFNLSAEATVDGRQFAIAYFDELQAVPGFEVVPVGVVEAAIRQNHISLESPADVRLLAQYLKVDAVVLGAVTDYSPYYPPRCGMQIEWYAANPGFHPIPHGYGLPWGTPAEEDIPEPLVLETEMSLAREQLKTQTPEYQPAQPPPPAMPAGTPIDRNKRKRDENVLLAEDQTARPKVQRRDTASQVSPEGNASGRQSTAAGRSVLVGGPEIGLGSLPPNWPDPRGLVPPPPAPHRPSASISNEPVFRHTRIYLGTDPDFTAALSNYSTFRDDSRFGGWSGYLQRSEDFIRFCCHKNIAEMLTARGGAGPVRVLWRWPDSRYTP
jgi:hypothetical protein